MHRPTSGGHCSRGAVPLPSSSVRTWQRCSIGFVPALAVALAGVCSATVAALPPPSPPPGYVNVPTSPDVLLNPAHQGAVGSEFTQQCDDANPDPPGPGEVGWHFILPQSVEEFRGGAQPGNIFAEIVIRFAEAGDVTLRFFGPPSAAHAYFTTPTDDTLLTGLADIFRRANLERGNDPSFNLSHTCAPAELPTTTSSSPSTTTTDPGAPTTTTGSTTAGTSTSIAAGVSTTTVGSAGGGGTTIVLVLPVTGSNGGRMLVPALLVLSLGTLALLVARRAPTS
jgi:hypothetical protein